MLIRSKIEYIECKILTRTNFNIKLKIGDNTISHGLSILSSLYKMIEK